MWGFGLSGTLNLSGGGGWGGGRGIPSRYKEMPKPQVASPWAPPPQSPALPPPTHCLSALPVGTLGICSGVDLLCDFWMSHLASLGFLCGCG
jgi:hypothetical protein